MTDKDIIEGLKRHKEVFPSNHPVRLYVDASIEYIYDVMNIKRVLENKIAPSNEKVRDIEMILKMGKKNEL